MSKIVYTENIPALRNIRHRCQKTQRKDGSLKVEVLMPNTIIKLSFDRKYNVFSKFVRSFCPQHFVGNMT